MNFNWQGILISLPGIILGLTVHEYCHAFAAYKLGDNTAKEMGRLSFNPIKHIDLIGFLFIVIAGFGWAKPVQFNPENLRNYRRDKAIIAAAGPISNLVFSFVFVALNWGWLALHLHVIDFSSFNSDSAFSKMYVYFFFIFFLVLRYGATINMGLFIFNLLPIPPLDGSHIAFSGLNLGPDAERRIMKIGAPLLFIILIVQNRANIRILPIGELINFILNPVLPSIGF
jgi:Zn-dependent protease